MLINKRAQTDSSIILSILVFQAFIIIALGFLDTTPTTVEVTGSGFGQNIITNIAALGWFNAILFIPIYVVIGYIILKLIRGGG